MYGNLVFYCCAYLNLSVFFFGAALLICASVLHAFICLCPIAVLRSFDSVYLNVSYRGSWTDMEQKITQVGPEYSAPFKCFCFFFPEI